MTDTKTPSTSPTLGSSIGSSAGTKTSSRRRVRVDAEKLAQLERLERQDRGQSGSKPQKSDPTVQMSIRMSKEVYRRFRALGRLERRTNGEMLQEMLEHYLADQGLDPDTPP